MKNVITILIIIFSCQILYAEQLISIKGKVIDAESKLPLPKASVRLLKANDSSLAKGVITDSKGVFEFKNAQSQKYIIKISYAGYEVFTKLLDKLQDVDLGALPLKLQASSTDQVTITAQKEAFQLNTDKQVINLDKNIIAGGGSAADALQTIPSVKVDIDGNVSLKGSSNVKVLIDGRQSGLSSSEALQQIPASSIESVELITNPSAKYEAEGNSGIINLVLKKERDNGINGLTSFNLGTGGRMNGSFNGNYRTQNYNIYGSYDLRLFNMESEGYYRQYYNQSVNMLKYYDRSGTGKREFNSHSFKLGVDYNLTPTDILGFYALANIGERSFDNYNNIKSMDSLNNVFDFFSSDSRDKTPNNNFDFSASYRKAISKKGEFFSADIIFSPSSMDGTSDYNYAFYNNDGSLNKLKPDSLNKSTSYSKGFNLAFQSDFSKFISQDAKIDLGLKASYKKSDADYDFFSYNRNENIWENQINISNQFVLNENILALYAIYSSSINAFQYQIGIRAENTKIDLELNSQNQNETNKKQYLSFFPSAHLKYNFSKYNSLQLSYSRRINRPSGRTLNPFKDYSDPKNISGGNPNINPEFYNSFEFSSSNIFESYSITGSVFYRKTSDLIERIRTYYDLDSSKTLTLPLNISKSENIGFELIFQQDLFSFWKYDASVSYYKTKIRGEYNSMDLSSDNYSWDAKINSFIKIMQGLDFQFSINYSSPVYEPQSKEFESYYISLGAKYEIIENKLFINLRSQDIFNTSKHESVSYLPNMNDHNYRKRSFTNLFLGISYKFNDYKPQRDKRNREEGGGGDDSEF